MAKQEAVQDEHNALEVHETWAKKERGYKGKLGAQQKEIEKLRSTVSSLEAGTTTDQIVDQATKVDTEQVHKDKFARAPWLPKCEGANCDTKNPTWKDETQCKSCKYPLGAKATIDQVDKCPGCGASGEGSAELKNNKEDGEGWD